MRGWEGVYTMFQSENLQGLPKCGIGGNFRRGLKAVEYENVDCISVAHNNRML